MSVGPHSAEKIAAVIQYQDVHEKGSGDISLRETPLFLSLPQRAEIDSGGISGAG